LLHLVHFFGYPNVVVKNINDLQIYSNTKKGSPTPAALKSLTSMKQKGYEKQFFAGFFILWRSPA